MKKLFAVTFTLGVLLFACATTSTISRVQDKWGPPAKMEELADTDVYYYYFYKGKGRTIMRSNIATETVMVGWVCVEITTDKAGNILKTRKYWAQPNIEG